MEPAFPHIFGEVASYLAKRVVTDVISQVFGEVAEGIETLNRINEAYVDEKGRPFKNIRLIYFLSFQFIFLVLS